MQNKKPQSRKLTAADELAQLVSMWLNTDDLQSVKLNDWLAVATDGLCDQARERIAIEFLQHYEDARAEAVSAGDSADVAASKALAALGKPRQARSQFLKTYLTVGEDELLRRLREGEWLTVYLMPFFIMASGVLMNIAARFVYYNYLDANKNDYMAVTPILTWLVVLLIWKSLVNPLSRWIHRRFLSRLLSFRDLDWLIILRPAALLPFVIVLTAGPYDWVNIRYTLLSMVLVWAYCFDESLMHAIGIRIKALRSRRKGFGQGGFA